MESSRTFALTSPSAPEGQLGSTRRPRSSRWRFDLVGLRWSGGDAEADVELRVRREGGAWSDWAEATPDSCDAPDPGRGEPEAKGVSAPVWADGADTVQYRISERLRGVIRVASGGPFGPQHHVRRFSGDPVVCEGDHVSSWDDVRRIALALPETSERLSRDLRQWRVKDKPFVWERPLRRADLEALGEAAPRGPDPRRTC